MVAKLGFQGEEELLLPGRLSSHHPAEAEETGDDVRTQVSAEYKRWTLSMMSVNLWLGETQPLKSTNPSDLSNSVSLFGPRALCLDNMGEEQQTSAGWILCEFVSEMIVVALLCIIWTNDCS